MKPAGFRVVDDSYRDEDPRGKWVPLLIAVLEGKTVFVPEADAKNAEQSLRQGIRGPAAKGRVLRLRTRTKVIDDEKGLVMWTETGEVARG